MQLTTWCTLLGAISYSRLLKKNFVAKIIPKEEQGWWRIRKWADVWRSANSRYSRLRNEGLIAILAQPPLSCPMITIRTSDCHGSNFGYNGQVLRRKHPALGIKLNPLSFLFQLARYHRNNTNYYTLNSLSLFWLAEIIDKIVDDNDSQNTKRSSKVAKELFSDYVKQKKLGELQEKKELAQTLKTYILCRSEKERFRSMYNKTIIRLGFCDIQNNQGLSKGHQPQPSPDLDLD